jgi:excisionase family DNA binding protein
MTEDQDGASTLDLAEAAELCKCSRHRMRKLAGMGAIPATKIGRRWVFPTRLLQEWIDERSRANVTRGPYYGATRRATVTQTLMRVK